MSSLLQPRYTPEQYLALEREAERKSEYFNGEIFAIAGASQQHNLITTNVVRELSTQLRSQPCQTYSSDMRVKVSENGLYTYPDVVVVCGEPRFEDGHRDTLLNPTVIIEVLSPSTEDYDRGRKFANYRRLESVTDYVLIAQDEIRVEHFVRQGEQWVLSEVNDPNGIIPLTSIGGSLTLRDIYEKVEFPNADPDGTSNDNGTA